MPKKKTRARKQRATPEQDERFIERKWAPVPASQEDRLCAYEKLFAPGNDYEAIDSPAHYKSGGLEVIDIAEAKLDLEEVVGALKFQIWRYTMRAGLKPGEDKLKDFKKAQWYVNRLVEYVEKHS